MSSNFSWSPNRQSDRHSSSPITAAKPAPQSPFLARRHRIRTAAELSSQSSPRLLAPPTRSSDATSTSSSTLVNVEGHADYRPWEVRSDSSAGDSVLSQEGYSRASQTTPTLPTFDEAGSLPSIHISPLPSRALSRAPSSAATSRPRNSKSPTSDRSAKRLANRSPRLRCPVDCRCSDQEIELGLCRRVVGSSSSASASGSESPSLDVRMHMTSRMALHEASSPMFGSREEEEDAWQSSNTTAERLSNSKQSYASGRDWKKDPILSPRGKRPRGQRLSDSTSIYKSFDRLEKGLDAAGALANDSDADSGAEQVREAQRRAESIARWAARRGVKSDRQESLQEKNEEDVNSRNEGFHSPLRSISAKAQSISGRSPQKSRSSQLVSPPFRTPETQSPSALSPSKGRRSIAAVFESMQKEREARAAEEQRRWQEKQATRERERAARAFGIHTARGSLGAFSPASQQDGLSKSRFSESPSSRNRPTEGSVALEKGPGSTGPPSRQSEGAPNYPASRTSAGKSPRLSSPSQSPSIDEPLPKDVSPRILQQDAAARIPETLSEVSEDEGDPVVREGEEYEMEEEAEAEAVTVKQGQGEGDHVRALESASQVYADDPNSGPVTPQPSQRAFSFPSRPMTLDLSPSSQPSNVSSPASSPRKNAHRRQNTSVVDVNSRLLSSSVEFAQNRLGTDPDSKVDTRLPVDAGDQGDAHLADAAEAGSKYPRTPINGILSSTKKRVMQQNQSDSGKRRQSVRFSPRPDYRSDSGSWDESSELRFPAQLQAHQVDASSGSGVALAGGRSLESAGSPQIVIPDLLQQHIGDDSATDQIQEKHEEDASQGRSQAKAASLQDAAKADTFSEQHTLWRSEALSISNARVEKKILPSSQPSRPTIHHVDALESNSTPSSSRTLPYPLPGSYVPTPAKASTSINISSHQARMNQKGVDALQPRSRFSGAAEGRTKDESDRSNSSSTSSTEGATGGKGAVEQPSESTSEVPRSSTPPPLFPPAATGSVEGGWDASDPRYSPRSPRPADMGQRKRFESPLRFGSSSSSSSSASPPSQNVNDNALNPTSVGDDSIQRTLKEILSNVTGSRRTQGTAANGGDPPRSGQKKRLEFGQALEEFKDQVSGMLGDAQGRGISIATAETQKHVQSSMEKRPAPQAAASGLRRSGSEEAPEEEAMLEAKTTELKEELMMALAMLVNRLRGERGSGMTPDEAAVSTFVGQKVRRTGFWVRHARLSVFGFVLLQLLLMVFLLQVAEDRGQRIRMFRPNSYGSQVLEYRTLYQPGPTPDIDWNSSSSSNPSPHDAEIYLVPLLTIPGLHDLTKSWPLLPSTKMTRLMSSVHHIKNGNLSPSSSLIDGNPQSLYSLHKSYIRLNGWKAFLLQLSLYTLQQTLAFLLLVCIAPIQIFYFLINPV